MVVLDPSSFATSAHTCTHIALRWAVDFAQKTIDGIALLTLTVNEESEPLVLDTRSLRIQAVHEKSDGQPLPFELGPAHPAFGSSLTIDLSKLALAKGASISVAIRYTTSPDASAVQWLSADQTASKQHPYLFTQCQAIHARSLLPCQDTPAVKAPYSASVTVPEPLVALMSAKSIGETASSGSIAYDFKQPVGVPAYLIALVVGPIVSRDISPRVRVWAEESVVDKAHYEFGETETMLSTAESLLGPYVWERYDLLVLPPSFPYGGMENPMLTFVTPTLLAGDRSLASVVAHEIAHSWTGNLVTNRTWEHFWLNEGFTVYVERLILGSMQGEQERQFDALDGLKALRDSVDSYGADHPFTHLVPNLKDADPDDAFSTVPYEKGFNFLFYLEQQLGGLAVFKGYLRAHVERFAYASITTPQWREFLYEYFQDKRAVLDAVDWAAWLNGPGMPPVANKFDDTLAQAAHKLADSWSTSSGAPETASVFMGFTSGQKQEFFNKLLAGPVLPHTTLASLDQTYSLSKSTNCEEAFRWFQLSLRSDWPPVFPAVVEFVTRQGRMKYVRPLYRALHKCASAGRLAVETFLKHRAQYHNIASTMIAKDLGL
eukprot:m.238626 g.238626  ORF g.238626 m.238626 type:complete len:604 (-) comp13332_c0_seq1:98-1909(-)